MPYGPAAPRPPSPEALLEAARREGGRVSRLKIFVGAAPGVGKTYEMLQNAHVRLKASVEVVASVVETHGRPETEALLRGLEVIPCKRPEYRDQILEEMGLNAVIVLRPQIALVDELAHTNAPGSRHFKRSSTMRDLAAGLSEQEKRDLLATVMDEFERLNRFIADLLDTTKGESGAVPNTARHDIGEIVGSALRRASKILVRHKASLELVADLPLLELDAVLFEQVMFNLLDNAAKYTPADTTIAIRGSREGDLASLQNIDEGEGIPPGEQESVFNKFYPAQKRDRVRPGSGLRIAICRGFVEAMHGTISAASRTDRGGAVLTIGLPIPAAVDAVESAA
jgi:K+-sensing histidine kinase KdpD